MAGSLEQVYDSQGHEGSIFHPQHLVIVRMPTYLLTTHVRTDVLLLTYLVMLLMPTTLDQLSTDDEKKPGR